MWFGFESYEILTGLNKLIKDFNCASLGFFIFLSCSFLLCYQEGQKISGIRRDFHYVCNENLSSPLCVCISLKMCLFCFFQEADLLSGNPGYTDPGIRVEEFSTVTAGKRWEKSRKRFSMCGEWEIAVKVTDGPQDKVLRRVGSTSVLSKAWWNLWVSGG